MPYILIAPDGSEAEFPDDYPREAAQAAIDRYIARTYPETVEPPGALETFGKEALLSAAPTAGGLAGFVGGASLGALTGPFAPIASPVLGIAGALGAGLGVSELQQMALEDTDAGRAVAETLGVTPEEMAAAREANPYASLFGQFAPSALAFKPTLPTRFFAGAGADEAGQLAAQALRREAAISGGVTAGVEAGMQAYSDEDFDLGRIATAGALGSMFLRPRERTAAVMRKFTPASVEDLLFGPASPVDELAASAARAGEGLAETPSGLAPEEQFGFDFGDLPTGPVRPQDIPEGAAESVSLGRNLRQGELFGPRAPSTTQAEPSVITPEGEIWPRSVWDAGAAEGRKRQIELGQRAAVERAAAEQGAADAEITAKSAAAVTAAARRKGVLDQLYTAPVPVTRSAILTEFKANGGEQKELNTFLGELKESGLAESTSKGWKLTKEGRAAAAQDEIPFWREESQALISGEPVQGEFDLAAVFRGMERADARARQAITAVDAGQAITAAELRTVAKDLGLFTSNNANKRTLYGQIKRRLQETKSLETTTKTPKATETPKAIANKRNVPKKTEPAEPATSLEPKAPVISTDTIPPSVADTAGGVPPIGGGELAPTTAPAGARSVRSTRRVEGFDPLPGKMTVERFPRTTPTRVEDVQPAGREPYKPLGTAEKKTPGVSQRVVTALREGNLGKVLDELQFADRPKGHPDQGGNVINAVASMLSDITRRVRKADGARMPDAVLAKIKANEVERVAREYGVQEGTADHARYKKVIEDAIDKDLDFSKREYSPASQALINKQGAYSVQRMVPRTRSGEIASRGALGDAEVYVEGVKLSKVQKARIAEMKAEGRVAEYDPKENAFYFTEAGLTDEIITHEIVHSVAFEVMNKYRSAAGRKTLSSNQLAAAKRIDTIYKGTKKALAKEFPSAYKSVDEFISYALSNAPLQERLSKIKVSDIRGGKSFPSKMSSAWDGIVRALARMVGLDKYAVDMLKSQPAAEAQLMDNALLQVGNAFKDIVSVPKAHTSYRGKPLPATKAADKVEERSITDIEVSLAGKVSGMSGFLGAAKDAAKRFDIRESINKLRRDLQNQADAAKQLQRNQRRLGLSNDLNDKITTSASTAANRLMELTPLRQRMDRLLATLNNRYKLPHSALVGKLHLFAIGVGERGARENLFITRVPLSREADVRRAEILEAISKENGVPPAEALKLREELNTIIEADLRNNVAERYVAGQPLGKVASPESLDIDSSLYDVAGNYTKNELATIRATTQAEFERNPELREIFDPNNGILRQIKDKTIAFNKQSGFHPSQLDSLIAFYNNPNYMPFKGGVVGPNDKYLDLINYSSDRLSGDLTEVPVARSGRSSTSDNPVLQILSDAAKASYKASRNEVVEELVRLIKAGQVKGRLVNTSSFRDRFSDALNLEGLKGTDRVFRYLPNGKLEVYEVLDEPILQAVKGFITDANPFFRGLGKVTSSFASLHTRFNPSFPVYNFVRDTITNASIVAAGPYGPAVGAKYASNTAARVANGGLLKSLRAATLYSKGDVATIAKLAEKDPYYASLKSYLDSGGYVTYRDTYGIEEISNALAQDIAAQAGKNKFLTTAKQVGDVFNIWMDGFELTTRVSAYDAIMPEALGRKAKELGRDLTAKEAAKVSEEVVAYTRGLFDFSEVGKYGREAGAMFMFIRPAMTGAVRFWDALSPAFLNVDSELARLRKTASLNPEQIRSIIKQQAKEQDRAISTAQLDEAVAAEVQRRESAFRQNFAIEKRNAQIVSTAALGAGMFFYNLAVAAADNDEMGRNKVITDNMDIWGRNLRIPMPKGVQEFVGKGNEYFQIPWGFGFGMFGSMGAQLAAVESGGQSIGEALSNMIPVILDSAVPLPSPQYSPLDHPTAFMMASVTPSVARPLVEWAMGVDAFGREIYQNRMNNFSDPYTGGETLPEMYSIAAEWMANTFGAENSMSPKTMHFFANSYADGIARIVANGVGLASVVQGDREFDFKEHVTPLASFVGRTSSVDYGDYKDIEAKVNRVNAILKSLEGRPDQLRDYLQRNPTANMAVRYFNKKKNGRLRDIQQRTNEVRRDPRLSYQEKRDRLDVLRERRDREMYNIVNAMEAWLP